MDPDVKRRLPYWAVLFSVAVFFIWGLGNNSCDFGTIRPRVSLIKSSQRAMATALEAYWVDHHAYPAMKPLREFKVRGSADPRSAHATTLSAIEPGGGAIQGLTTPVAYLPFLPGDEALQPPKLGEKKRAFAPLRRLFSFGFRGAEAPWPYAYYNYRNVGWLVWSAGPDGVYDIQDPAAVYDPAARVPSDALYALTYDPTNGSMSRGDVYRAKQ